MMLDEAFAIKSSALESEGIRLVDHESLEKKNDQIGFFIHLCLIVTVITPMWTSQMQQSPFKNAHTKIVRMFAQLHHTQIHQQFTNIQSGFQHPQRANIGISFEHRVHCQQHNFKIDATFTSDIER